MFNQVIATNYVYVYIHIGHSITVAGLLGLSKVTDDVDNMEEINHTNHSGNPSKL